MIIFLFPVSRDSPALVPMKILLLDEPVHPIPARYPRAVLLSPVAIKFRAPCHNAVFPDPVVFQNILFHQMTVLLHQIVLE